MDFFELQNMEVALNQNRRNRDEIGTKLEQNQDEIGMKSERNWDETGTKLG